MQINIAVVQFEIRPFAPAENLAKAEQFIKEASSKADMIVFPEDFLTGPLGGNKAFVDYEDDYIQHFQHLAAKYRIDLVPGSFVEGDHNALYNTTYYIDKTGTIRGKYRKVNLWHPERIYLTPGNSSCILDTPYGRVGLLICWDLIFPEVFRCMLRQNVEIVICPSYWCFEDASAAGLMHEPNSEIKLVNALCTARAFENEIILVFVNAAAYSNVRQGTDRLFGRSQITAPFKGPLHILPHSDEEMFIQTVDTDILKDAEYAYKIRKDLDVQVPLLS
jgi:predicted amidohydrolase